MGRRCPGGLVDRLARLRREDRRTVDTAHPQSRVDIGLRLRASQRFQIPPGDDRLRERRELRVREVLLQHHPAAEDHPKTGAAATWCVDQSADLFQDREREHLRLIDYNGNPSRAIFAHGEVHQRQSQLAFVHAAMRQRERMEDRLQEPRPSVESPALERGDSKPGLKLRGEDPNQHRFAGSGRPNDQGRPLATADRSKRGDPRGVDRLAGDV